MKQMVKGYIFRILVACIHPFEWREADMLVSSEFCFTANRIFIITCDFVLSALLLLYPKVPL